MFGQDLAHLALTAVIAGFFAAIGWFIATRIMLAIFKA
jgi:hypothetical protein